MKRNALGPCGTALVAAWVALGAPASAQDAPAADSLLWPSWTQRFGTLGLSTEPEPTALWTPQGHPRLRCVAAGVAGATAGALAEVLRDDPIDWPPGFDHFPARRWRSLPRMGALFGKALACPAPLGRVVVDPVPRDRPEP